MEYEAARLAVKQKTRVVYGGDREGTIDNLAADGAAGYIAKFVPEGQLGWIWVSLSSLEPAEVAEPAEEPAAEEVPATFPGKSLYELVESLIQAAAEDDFDLATSPAYREIVHRLDAIQIYQGTEAVIIRMILAGRREVGK